MKQVLVETVNEDLSLDTFINKLKARVGTLLSSDDYDDNVGTFTKVVNQISATQSVTYDIIVKGDVYPDGKFFIYIFPYGNVDTPENLTINGVEYSIEDVNDSDWDVRNWGVFDEQEELQI